MFTNTNTRIISIANRDIVIFFIVFISDDITTTEIIIIIHLNIRSFVFKKKHKNE